MNQLFYMKYERNAFTYFKRSNEDGLLFGGLPDIDLKKILLKLQIFQTGLSVIVANELLPGDFNEENVIQMMGSVDEDIILSAH